MALFDPGNAAVVLTGREYGFSHTADGIPVEGGLLDMPGLDPGEGPAGLGVLAQALAVALRNKRTKYAARVEICHALLFNLLVFITTSLPLGSIDISCYYWLQDHDSHVYILKHQGEECIL